MGQPKIAILGAYFSYILIPLLALGLHLRGFWLLLPSLFLYSLVPILDGLTSNDRSNLDVGDLSKMQVKLLQFAPIGFLFLYALMILFYVFSAADLSLVELLFSILSLGVVGSISIPASHELVHKRDPFRRLIARFGLSLVCYGHFEYNHVYGHHKDAATKEDNHTAWAHESFYTYLLRTVHGGFTFCLRPENTRYRMSQFFIFSILIVFLLGVFVSFYAVILFLGQALIAILALEAVAYIEHYGLMRQSMNSKLEPMSLHHSWDSYHRFSNYITFMLPRHADHHKMASKDYFLLQSNDQAPVLPFGYPVMILIALLPPLWRKLMDPLLLQAQSSKRYGVVRSRSEPQYTQDEVNL